MSLYKAYLKGIYSVFKYTRTYIRTYTRVHVRNYKRIQYASILPRDNAT